MRHKMLFPAMLALMLSAGPRAACQSASELLQKAIYTQETLGDIDAAIEIYRQILAEAKDNRLYAAQAQYRLGVCYLSKGLDAEACEAFQKLIKDYPDQKELVANARARCPGKLQLLPEPWVDGEVLEMTLKLPAGLEVGAFIWTANLEQVGGRDAWRFLTRRYIVGGNNQGVSYALVDRETSRPIRSLFRHTVLGELEAEYEPNLVKSKAKGKDGVREFKLERVLYDNEQAMHLMRRLPLAEGYEASLPIFSPGSAKMIDVGLAVTARETVEVPAGKFECYKAEFSLGEGPSFQTFWYSTDPKHYLVKFESGGVQGELAVIRQDRGSAPVEYRDEEFGFSLTVPHGWHSYRQKPEQADAATTVHLLDPEAAAFSGFSFKKPKDPEAHDENAIRAAAEKEIVDRQKIFKDYKVRPETWSTRAVSGAPALSVVADYADGQKAMVEYLTWVRTRSLDSLFVTRLNHDEFDGFRPAFDKIIDSLQLRP